MDAVAERRSSVMGAEFSKLVADNIPQLAWVADAKGWIHWYNRRWYEYTGTTLAEMEGWGWRAVHHPDHVDRVVERFSFAVASGEPFEDVFPLRSASGEYRQFLTRANPIRDETGKITHWFGSNTDVTEQLATQQQLRDMSRRLNAILDNTQMAVFLMDEQQHCIFANAAAERLTGYRFAELEGRALHDVVHHSRPDGSPYPIEDCPIGRAFPRQAQMQGEELFVAPDGSFYPVAFTASPLLDDAGRPVGTVIEARNIAQRKAREAALQASDERYRTLFRSMEQGFCVLQVSFDEPVRQARKQSLRIRAGARPAFRRGRRERGTRGTQQRKDDRQLDDSHRAEQG